MAAIVAQGSAPLVIDSDYLVSWYTWCQDQWGINSVAVAIDSFTGTPNMGDLAEAFQNLTEANQQNFLPTQATILGTRVTKLTGAAPHPIAGVATSGVLGLVAGPPMPTQSTGLITARTALAGRKYRGRIFTPFVPPSMVGADGLPSVGYKGLIGTFGDYIYSVGQTLTAATTDTITLHAVIWHRAALGSTPVVSHTARSYWGTMRKRGDLGRSNPKSIPL